MRNPFRNILTVIAVLGCVFALQSCNKEDRLNPKPSTLITSETAFGSKERILSQVNGLYSVLKAGRFLGSWYYIASDIRAGDFICTNLNAATGATTYQLLTQTTTSEVVATWQAGYQAINACNVFIDGLNKTDAAIIDKALSDKYLAEARFIRAVAYYNLLQLYARPYLDGAGSKPGLPLRLTGNTQPGNYDLARSSVKETYAQVLDDLDFAEQNLPEKYSSAFLNTTRAHKNSAIAFKTKVYLSMQDYVNVRAEADKIVTQDAPFYASSGVKNELQADVRTVFQSPYTTSESVFSVPFTANDAPGIGLAEYYLPGKADGGTTASNGTGQYSLDPNGVIADPFWSADDIRRKFIVKGTVSGKPWLFKFNQASPYIDYAPVIRYAEVLLNLAEAIVKSSGTVDNRAIALLNAVHHRSDSGKLFTESDFADAGELTEAILKERHIEFLGEGLRTADLMRLGLPIPAKPANAVPEAQPSAPNYIYPISSDELILNKLMENN